MGRVLGVDAGTVRVGLAITDPSRMLATPHATIDADPDPAVTAARLAEVATAESCDTVVVGLPRALSGRETDSTRMARTLASALADLGATVHLWDERLTSVTAERTLRAAGARREERRAAKDRIAAAVILQAWLDAGQPHAPPHAAPTRRGRTSG